MSFLDPFQLDELAYLAYNSDREIRGELAIGAIKDENDYTSNFTGALRRNINSYSRSGLSATSFLLQHEVEREVGADAAIILTRGNQSKVAIFEAKWPRFATSGYRWDYQQTASGLSHFSDQLDRQKRWCEVFAVFEMFYSEHPPGTKLPYLVDQGSSCIWHGDIELFRSRRPNPNAVWNQNELQILLSSKKVNIAKVMIEFGQCNVGRPINMRAPEEIGVEFRLPKNLLVIRADIE